MLKLKLQYFGHLMAKIWLIWKDPDDGIDWMQEENRTTEDELVGWHHWLDGDEFEPSLRDGEGQGSLACCSPWGCEESDMTEWLNNKLLFIFIDVITPIFWNFFSFLDVWTALKVKVKSLSHVWLSCDFMDYSPPSSSVYGILKAKILEWFAISFYRRSSQPKDWTHISCIASGLFTTEPPGKLQVKGCWQIKILDIPMYYSGY